MPPGPFFSSDATPAWTQPAILILEMLRIVPIHLALDRIDK